VALVGVVVGLVLGLGAVPALAGGPKLVLAMPFDEGTWIDAYDWSSAQPASTVAVSGFRPARGQE